MEKNKLKIKNKSKKIIEITKNEKKFGEYLFDNIDSLNIDEIKKLIFDDFAFPNIIDNENISLILKGKKIISFLKVFEFNKKKKVKY